MISLTELGSFKERFEKGAVSETTTERAPIDVRCEELGNIKNAFEKGQVRNSIDEGEDVSAFGMV